MTYWVLNGREMANCNCEYGCNCQFGGLPDKGGCQAVFGMDIEEGHHGDTDLSGLKIAAAFRWPGPIHEGHGEAAAFVDERATDEQRKALLTIMTGGDTDPFATVFAVFAAMVENVSRAAIRADRVRRRCRRTHGAAARSTARSKWTACRSEASSTASRSGRRFACEGGFEYEVAEVGSGTSRSISPIEFAHSNSYGQFAHLHLDSHGIVHA